MQSHLNSILIIVIIKAITSISLTTTLISPKSRPLDEETKYFDSIKSIYRSIASTSLYLTVKVIEIDDRSRIIPNLDWSFSTATEQNKISPPLEFQNQQNLRNVDSKSGCSYFFRVHASNKNNFVRFSNCSIAFIYFIKDEETLSKILFKETLCVENVPECDPSYNWHFIFVQKIQNLTNLMSPVNSNVLKVVHNAVLFVDEQTSPKGKIEKGPIIYILRRSKWRLYSAFGFSKKESIFSLQLQYDTQSGNYNGEKIEISSFMPIRPKFVNEYRFSILRNEKSTYPGLMLAHEILKFVNSTITQFLPPSKLTSPNWITIPHGINEWNWKQSAVSRIIDFNYVVFITAKPVHIARSFEFLIEPFKGFVWLGTILSIVSIILGGFVISVVTKHVHFKTQNTNTNRKDITNLDSSSPPNFLQGLLSAIIDINWLVLTLLLPLLDQAYGNVSKKTIRSMRLRVLITLWMLAAIVLVNLYKSNIAAFLIQPSFTQPPETFKDLVDSKYNVYTVSSIIKEGYVAKLLSDKSGLPQDACLKMVKGAKHPTQCFKTITTGEANGCVAFEIMVKASARADLTGLDGKELYQLSKEKLYPDYAAISISPSLPNKKFLDQVIAYLDQGGLINKWSAVRTDFNSNLGRKKAAAEARNRSEEIHGVNLDVVNSDDIIYPIIILVTGCLGSLLLLFYEIMKSHKRTSAVKIIM